jgi:hypothetical protein
MLKDGKNGTERVAGPEMGREWMGKQILLDAFLVHFQRIIDD